MSRDHDNLAIAMSETSSDRVLKLDFVIFQCTSASMDLEVEYSVDDHNERAGSLQELLRRSLRSSILCAR